MAAMPPSTQNRSPARARTGAASRLETRMRRPASARAAVRTARASVPIVERKHTDKTLLFPVWDSLVIPLATALAAGFAASTNPSLQSMNAHLAKIVEQIPLATDEAQIATLIAAQQSIGTSIAKDEERARIGQLYDALKASWDRPITVNLTVPVTVRDITTKVTTSTRIGPTTGSAGGRFLGAQ